MIFRKNKKIAKALDEALEMKRSGKSDADIVKLYPEFSVELKSLLSTAEIIEKGKDNVRPSEAILQKILTRLNGVTESVDARYSSAEEQTAGDKVKNVLLNFNQTFMNKKVYVGAAVGVFLLAIIVGVGWYSLPAAPEDPLAALQKNEDEFSAEIDYLASLAVDPFVDLDGDLQKIIDSNGETSDSDSSAPATLDSGMEEIETSLDNFQKSLSEMNSLGEGASLSEVDDTLSTIDQVY